MVFSITAAQVAQRGCGSGTVSCEGPGWIEQLETSLTFLEQGPSHSHAAALQHLQTLEEEECEEEEEEEEAGGI